MEQLEKVRYRNVSAGIVGANIFDEEGKRDAVAVKPGETVELDERERGMTARASVKPENNPLVGLGPDGGPALVPDTEERPTGPAAAPAGEAPEGSFQDDEEVATPDAPAAEKG